GVELHRRAAGLAHAFLHLGGEAPQVEVARPDLGPGVGDADERLVEIGVREADRLQHRARRRAARALGEGVALVLGIQGAHERPPAARASWATPASVERAAPGYEPSTFSVGANSARCESARLQEISCCPM